MTIAKQNMLLACALVLTVGLISCSSDKNMTAVPSGPTGMLVHTPVFIHKNGKSKALTAYKKDAFIKLNLDDKMKLTPVLAGGRGLTTLTVQSDCAVFNLPLGTDSVSLPYSSEYNIVQFFSAKTLLNDINPGTTQLTCSMHFTVSAINGSTHSFSLPKVLLTTEDPDSNTVQVFDVGHPVSDYDGFLKIDYNHMDQYRIQINGVHFYTSQLDCEINQATIDKSLIQNPLYGIRFEPRAGVDPQFAAQRYASQQYCRLIVYGRNSTVVAASNLILMTMAKPNFSIKRVPSNYPNPCSSKNIFDYSWRDYAVTNNGQKRRFFALPTGGKSTVDYESFFIGGTQPNIYLWSQQTVPTVVSVQAPSTSLDGYAVFEVDPEQSVDVRIGVQPHNFACDFSYRPPIEYTVAINDKEIPIYQIANPSLVNAADNILYTARLEKQFVMQVTRFGANTRYEPAEHQCDENFYCSAGEQPHYRVQPAPMTAANHYQGLCNNVN